jgi:hypothetical protein
VLRLINAFLFNIGLMFICGVMLYVNFPEQISTIVETWGAALGPVGLIILLLIAMPRRGQL